MGEIATLTQWLIGGWILAVMAVVVFRILSGGISLNGLLSLEPNAPYGFDRLQLVAVTFFFAGGYVITSLYRAPGEPLPNIPAPLLLILIGSNGTYLAVKYATLMRGVGGGK